MAAIVQYFQDASQKSLGVTNPQKGRHSPEDQQPSTGEEEKWNFRKKSKIGKGLETWKGAWLSRVRGALGIYTREQQGSNHEVM